VRAYFCVPKVFLTYSNNYSRIFLYDLPINAPHRKPAIIYANGFLYPISNKIEDIYCITSVIRLLNKNIQPHLIAVHPHLLV